jgi:hypothetical protein
MNGPSVHKKFIFNEKIDQDYLFSLYEDDYAYIIEVFNNSLETIMGEMPVLTGAFEASDLSTLKKSAHKLKPLFGFTGLLTHQEELARFENACANGSNSSNVTMHYIEVLDVIKDGKNILQEDYNRLIAFMS